MNSLSPQPRHRSNSFNKTQRNSISSTEQPSLNNIDEMLKGDNILRGKKANRRSIPVSPDEMIPRTIEKYVLRTTIGEGMHSIYKLASPATEPSKKLACKVIEKKKCSAEPTIQNAVEKELNTLSKLNNPFIVNLIDCLSDNHRYYIFFDYCPKTLLDILLKSGPLTELNASRIFKQIVQGVKYIHDSMIVHRDLKLENILISNDYDTDIKSSPSSPSSSSPLSSLGSSNLYKSGNINSPSNIIGIPKISNFSFSKCINDQENDGLVSTPCGSPNYASPETLSGKPYDGKISDLWSLGVILYTMVVGDLPWTAKQRPKMFDQIRKGQYKIPSNLSENCKNLISSLLCVDVSKRIKMDKLINHPFLKAVKYPKFLTQNGVPLSYSTKSLTLAIILSLPEKVQIGLGSSSSSDLILTDEAGNESSILSPKCGKVDQKKRKAMIPKPKRSVTSMTINANNYI